jgi:FtsP/CotA-like multicopper oxidase with cupredoxin domain
VDNVFLQAKPGESLEYKYQLPYNHAPGLHWYHAHHHGSSALHLMGGLVGALVVEDVEDMISDLPLSLLEADDHLLVLTRMIFAQATMSGLVSQGCGPSFACDPVSQGPLCTGDEETSPWNLFREYSYPEFAAAAGSTLPIDVVFAEGWADRNFVLVNGQYRPTLELNASSPSVLRMVHAHGAGPMLLALTPADGGPADGCAFTILAWDGVYLDGRLPVNPTNETLNVVAAGRVDVEILCTTPGLYKVTEQQETMLWLRVNATQGPARDGVTSAELAAIQRPWYLSDLRGVSEEEIDSTYNVFITQENFRPDLCQFWLGVGKDCSDISPYGASILPNTTNNDNCAFSQFGGSMGLHPGQWTDHYM